MKSIIATTIIAAIIDNIWHPVKRAVVSVGDKSEYSRYQAHESYKRPWLDYEATKTIE